MRGEKFVNFVEKLYPIGSPPHVRGKDDLFNKESLLRGITPACAGKSQKEQE